VSQKSAGEIFLLIWGILALFAFLCLSRNLLGVRDMLVRRVVGVYSARQVTDEKNLKRRAAITSLIGVMLGVFGAIALVAALVMGLSG
jgi:hypothetical protein